MLANVTVLLMQYFMLNEQFFWSIILLTNLKSRVYDKATLDNVMGKKGPRLSIGKPQIDRSQEWR